MANGPRNMQDVARRFLIYLAVIGIIAIIAVAVLMPHLSTHGPHS